LFITSPRGTQPIPDLGQLAVIFPVTRGQSGEHVWLREVVEHDRLAPRTRTCVNSSVLSSGPGAVHQRLLWPPRRHPIRPITQQFVCRIPRVLCRGAHGAVVLGTHPYSRPGVVPIMWTHGARFLADSSPS
jgi:hypothetical protein